MFGWRVTATFSCAFVVALGSPIASADQRDTGIASFYQAVPPSPDKLTAAHRHLPFGTRVRVTRISTGKHVIVRINDRGPFIKGRVIDLSLHAAKQLDMIDAGVTRVRVEIIPDVKHDPAIAYGVPEICDGSGLIPVAAHD